MSTCDGCGADVDPGNHIEIENPVGGEPALLVQTLCDECATRLHNLLGLIGERVTFAAYWCPECDWFDVAPASGHPDACADCGIVLEEKVLTKTTVFDNARRTNARVIDPC